MANGSRIARVIPGDLTREERDNCHYLIWNTEDDFDNHEDGRREYGEIMDYHRALGFPHWYLPFAPMPVCHESFMTERDALNKANTIINS